MFAGGIHTLLSGAWNYGWGKVDWGKFHLFHLPYTRLLQVKQIVNYSVKINLIWHRNSNTQPTHWKGNFIVEKAEEEMRLDWKFTGIPELFAQHCFSLVWWVEKWIKLCWCFWRWLNQMESSLTGWGNHRKTTFLWKSDQNVYSSSLDFITLVPFKKAFFESSQIHLNISRQWVLFISTFFSTHFLHCISMCNWEKFPFFQFLRISGKKWTKVHCRLKKLKSWHRSHYIQIFFNKRWNYSWFSCSKTFLVQFELFISWTPDELLLTF